MVWEPSDFSCTTCALCDVNLIQELCWYFLISLLNWNFLIKYFFRQSSYPTSLHWLSTSIWNYSTSHLRNCLALSFPGETSFTVPPICHGMTEGKFPRKEEAIKNKINLTGCRFRSKKNRRGRGRCARAPRRVGSGWAWARGHGEESKPWTPSPLAVASSKAADGTGQKPRRNQCRRGADYWRIQERGGRGRWRALRGMGRTADGVNGDPLPGATGSRVQAPEPPAPAAKPGA